MFTTTYLLFQGMSPVESRALSESDRRQRLLEQVAADSRKPVPAHIWPRGRSDAEAIDYIKGLVDREGKVELWGFGRTVTRQIKRMTNRLQFYEGLDVVLIREIIEPGDAAPVRTAIQVGRVPLWAR